MTEPTDWIQHGGVMTTHPDGGKSFEAIPWQGLATDETADKLIEWLNQNIPEGGSWSKVNNYVSQGSVSYNCPCWMMVAESNGYQVNAGNTWYDLFFYPDPTAITLETLHKGASAATS